MRRIGLVAVLAATACAGERTPPVPGWLQPVFKDLDTLLTHAQRDSLRTIDIDSAFVFRNHELARALEGMGPVWQRTPAGDTLIARGENLPGVQVNLFLDLYQQWLQRKAPDLRAALHRMSPDYVSNYRAIFGVDSTLIADDIDGDGRADRLVRETRKSGLAPAELGGVTERRLALYVGTSRKPAWASDWNDMEGTSLRERYRLDGGGSLLLVVDAGSEWDAHRLLRAHHGSVRPVVTLEQKDPLDIPHFSVRTATDSVVVTASAAVAVEGRSEPSSIRCRMNFLPAWQVTSSRHDRSVLASWQVCVEMQLGPEAPEPGGA